MVGGLLGVDVDLPLTDGELLAGEVGFDGAGAGVGALGGDVGRTGGGVEIAGGTEIVMTVCGASVTGPTVTLLETSLACQVVYSAASMAGVAVPRLVLL